MKRLILLFALTQLGCLLGHAQQPFTGHAGVYYLGSTGVPISNAAYANPDISGMVLRFMWEDLETAPGVYDWSFLDTERGKAAANGKKISIQPLGTPGWLGAIGVQTYDYIDRNPNHPTYNQILSDVIPWDTLFASRYRMLLEQLASRYASDTLVTYVNAIGGAFSRNLPDSVVIDTATRAMAAFWTTFPYNADTLGQRMTAMTDTYMALFPATPMWCSIDYVTFEAQASGRPRNYLASIAASHGIAHYPDRFGLWREDVAGCNPNLGNLSSGSQWQIIVQNPCRTGAQMLWNVQDGPTRMNQCGITPNTEQVVLDSAVNKGLALGMRYLEIYAADISDPGLSSNIRRADSVLKDKASQCMLTTSRRPDGASTFDLHPVPASTWIAFQLPHPIKDAGYHILDARCGRIKSGHSDGLILIHDLPPGMYVLQLETDQGILSRRFLKE